MKYSKLSHVSWIISTMLMLYSCVVAQSEHSSKIDAFVYIDFFQRGSMPRDASVTFQGEVYNSPGILIEKVESFHCSLRPGVEYPLQISRGKSISYSIGMSLPEGYVAVIDGKIQGGHFLPALDFASARAHSISIRRAEVLNPDYVMEAGRSSDLQVGDIKWEIGLGRRSNGGGAGFIQLASANLDDIFNRQAWTLHIPPCNEGEIDVIREPVLEGDPVLRQVKTASCLVDFIESPTSATSLYEVRVYRDSNYDPVVMRYVPVPASLIKAYNFSNVDGNKLKISTSSLYYPEESKLITCSPDGNLMDWTLREEINRLVRTTIIDNQNIGGKRSETTEISMVAASPSLGTFNTIRSRKVFSPPVEVGKNRIGERMISRTINLGEPDERTEQVRYYTDHKSPGFGLPSFRTGFFGEWSHYVYEETSKVKSPMHEFAQWASQQNVPGVMTGLLPRQRALLYEYTPYEDWAFDNIDTVKTTAIAAAFKSKKAARRTFLNGYGWNEFKVIPVKVDDEIQMGQTIYPTGSYENRPLVFPTGDPGPSRGWRQFIEINRITDPGFKTTVYSARHVPPPNGGSYDYRLAFKPYMENRSDGTKSAYGYASSSLYQGVADAWIEIELKGKATSVVDVNQNFLIESPWTGVNFRGGISLFLAGQIFNSPGAETTRESIYSQNSNKLSACVQAVHEGVLFEVDNVTLIEGQSTKTVKVYSARGDLVRTENWVYLEGKQWGLVDVISSKWDKSGYITESKRIDGASGEEKIIYMAWYHEYKLQWELDEKGVASAYSYINGLGSPTSVSRSVDHNTECFPETVTLGFKYDVLGRCVATSPLYGSSLKEETEFDGQGLIRWTKNIDGLVTHYSYTKHSVSGAKVEISYPGGATDSLVMHKSGRPRFRAGNGQTSTFYSYGNSGEKTWARVDVGADSGNSSLHPWRKETRNWSGGLTLEEGESGSGIDFQRSYHYEANSSKLAFTKEIRVSENNSVSSGKIKRFNYDAIGNLSLLALDVDGQGIVDSSRDKIVRTESKFVHSGGALFKETAVSTYPKANSPTTLTETVRIRLNGFTSGLLAEKQIFDIHGNVYISSVHCDALTGISTATTSMQEGGIETLEKEAMGFVFMKQDRFGGQLKMVYDGARRPVYKYVQSPSGSNVVEAKIIYDVDKGRIAEVLVKRPNGEILNNVRLEYDMAGRVCRTFDNQGNDHRASFNNRGQVQKRWGTSVEPEWFIYDPVFGHLIEHHRWNNLSSSVDLAAVSSPPAGSIVVRYQRNPVTGLPVKRSEGSGTLVRDTIYSYDVLGRVRTIQTAGASSSIPNTVATSPVLTTFSYDPETGLPLLIDFGDNTADIRFSWSRGGLLESVTEGSDVRTFVNSDNGNGSSALKRLVENLPLYYNRIPSLANNDNHSTASRLTKTYTSDGVKGLVASTRLGVPNPHNPIELSIPRMSVGLSWDGSMLDAISADGFLVDYDYVPGTGLVSKREADEMIESRGYDRAYGAINDISTLCRDVNGVDLSLVARHEYGFTPEGRIKTIRQTGENYGIYGDALSGEISYDARKRLETFVVKQGTSSGLPIPGRQWSLSHDLNGNRVSETWSDAPIGRRTASILYDGLNRAVERSNPSWVEASGFDDDLDVATMTLSTPSGLNVLANEANHYFHAYLEKSSSSGWAEEVVEAVCSSGHTMMGSASWRPQNEVMKYDARGNRVEDSRWRYSWDARDQLVAMESLPGSGKDMKLVFRYDWMGRRYMKELYSKVGSSFATNPSRVTLYWWDERNLLKEASYSIGSWSQTGPINVALITEVNFYWGLDISNSFGGAGGAGGMIASRGRAAGTLQQSLYFPSYDASGNLVSMNRDGHSGVIFEYSPFGRNLRSSRLDFQSNGVDIPAPFGFATKYTDQETGLIYFGSRYYSPDEGRFLSRDPSYESGGANLYGYCFGDPLNRVDSQGFAPVATNGRGVLNSYGQALAEIARSNPNAAKSLLLSSQLREEVATAGIGSLIQDGGPVAVGNVRRALGEAAANALRDGRSEWRHLSLAGGASAYDAYYGFDVGSLDSLVARLFDDYGPLLEERWQTSVAIETQRAIDSAMLAAKHNSPTYKLKELAKGSFGAVVVDPLVFAFNTITASDVTTGAQLKYNGWGQGFGLEEVSDEERLFSAAMTLLPLSVDDFARVGRLTTRNGIALGLSHHPKHEAGGLLEKFSGHVDAKWWQQWDNYSSYQRGSLTLQNLIDSNIASAEVIHFNLDGINLHKFANWMNKRSDLSVQKLISNHRDVTNYELRSIIRDPQLYNKTLFYGEGGVPISYMELMDRINGFGR